MGFDWKEFLALAQDFENRIGAGYSDEASNRAAVSRAYYAAFCTVRNYAEANLGFQRTGTPQDHELLRRHLRQQGGVWTNVAAYLRELRAWRNQCDYDDVVPNLPALTSAALGRAAIVLSYCP
ncbi:MAG: hypothetical protein N2554_06480 [Fimbriimonadales bacterium]|nr:hypothetical protein [Fimbriimonadales bacterium]